MIIHITDSKVVDYKLIEASGRETGEQRVKELIKEGWAPLGGASESIDNEETYGSYVQAMVKYEAKE